MNFTTARFGPRLAAFLIDSLIKGVVGLILQKILFLLTSLQPESYTGLGLSWLVGLLIWGTYGGYFYSTKGTTPGKKIFNMSVVKGDEGRKLSFIDGFLRESIGHTVSSFTCLIGYLMALWTKDGKALHDYIFDTRVVERANP